MNDWGKVFEYRPRVHIDVTRDVFSGSCSGDYDHFDKKLDLLLAPCLPYTFPESVQLLSRHNQRPGVEVRCYRRMVCRKYHSDLGHSSRYTLAPSQDRGGCH